MASGAMRAGQKQLLKIGEVSKRTGVGIESLRFYESRGLISPAGRTEAGYRLYDDGVFERLSFIKKAQAVGFRLDEIARIIDEARHGRRPCAEVRRLAEERLAELESKLAELQRYREELRETVDAWGRQGAKEGVICGLIEGLQASSFHPPAAGPGPTRRKRARRM